MPDLPPTYNRFTRRFNNVNLRPVILFSLGFTTIWSIATSISFQRNRIASPNYLSVALMNYELGFLMVYAILGILQVMGFILFFFYPTQLRSIRLYFYAATIAAVLATAAELTRVIIHFTLKSDIISACVSKELATIPIPQTGDTASATLDCLASWYSNSYWRIGSLAVTGLFVFMLTTFIWSYVLFLQSPRAATTATPSRPNAPYAYPLATYPQPPFPPPNAPSTTAPEFYSAPPYAPPLPGYEGGSGGDWKDEKEEQGPTGYQVANPVITNHEEEVTLEPRRSAVEGRV